MGLTLAASDQIERPVHAVGQQDVRVSRGPSHGLVALVAPTTGAYGSFEESVALFPPGGNVVWPGSAFGAGSGNGTR